MRIPAATRRPRYASVVDKSTRRLWPVALLTAAGVLAIAGCAELTGEPGDRLGASLASWSEADVPADTLEAVVAPGRPVVVDEAVYEALLELEAASDADELMGAARRDGDFLLALGYDRCQGVQLYADRGRDQLWFQIPREREQISCVWAPYTIEVWAVPVEDLPAAPDQLELVSPADR